MGVPFAFVGKSAILSIPSSVWTLSGPAPSEPWGAITYGSGPALFVAVASTAASAYYVSTSPDGINWTSRTSPINSGGSGIAYGNGIFVAVNSDSATTSCITSPDGVNWTSRAGLANTTDWSSVAFGNGIFVAVAQNGLRCATSTDGITWTTRTISASIWVRVRFLNNQFVAVGINACATSSDGITWTTRTIGTGTWVDVSYGAGLYVAVANSGVARIRTTPDFSLWTTRATSPALNCITFHNSKFTALGTVDSVVESADGITWATDATRTTSGNNWRDVCVAGGKYVSVAQSGTPGTGPRIQYKLDT